MEIKRKKSVKLAGGVQKKIAKALTPLLTYSSRRRQNKTRLPQPANQFQSQNGFAATRRRHDIDFSIFEIFRCMIQHALLIITKCAPKTHPIKAIHINLIIHHNVCMNLYTLCHNSIVTHPKGKKQDTRPRPTTGAKRTGRLLAFDNTYRKLSDVYSTSIYKYILRKIQC